MSEAAVELKVAGQTYQVVSSAQESELQRLAKVVEDALYGVTAPGRQPSPQALVLAAITLAHELEVARAETAELKKNYKKALGSLLGRVDEVLAESEAALSEPEPAEATVNIKRPGSNSDPRNLGR